MWNSFYLRTNLLQDFHIYISVPLTFSFIEFKTDGLDIYLFQGKWAEEEFFLYSVYGGFEMWMILSSFQSFFPFFSVSFFAFWEFLSCFFNKKFPFHLFQCFLSHFLSVSFLFFHKKFPPYLFFRCFLPCFLRVFFVFFCKQFPSSFFLQSFFPHFFESFPLITGEFPSSHIECRKQRKYLTELMYLKGSIRRSKLAILS